MQNYFTQNLAIWNIYVILSISFNVILYTNFVYIVSQEKTSSTVIGFEDVWSYVCVSATVNTVRGWSVE